MATEQGCAARRRRGILCALLAAGALAVPAVDARVTRITVTSKVSPAYNGQSFGAAGQYETYAGTLTGEVDPNDRRSAIIQDIQFAPRNSRGMVEYTTTFFLTKPIDMSRSSGMLFQQVPNRGGRIDIGGRAAGDVGLSSGWQGDMTGTQLERVTVPIARNPDGSSITGPYTFTIADLGLGSPISADGSTANIYAGLNNPSIPYPPATLVNTVIDYDYGTSFNYNDMAGFISTAPIVVKKLIPTYVPQVDSDGNELPGIKPLMAEMPLGTYTGWNVTSNGFYKDQACAFSGGFIPFAKTKAERLARNDPRPSLEERYSSFTAFYYQAAAVLNRLVAQRYMLPEDAGRELNLALNGVLQNNLLPKDALAESLSMRAPRAATQTGHSARTPGALGATMVEED